MYGLTANSPECASVVPTDCSYVTPGCLNATHWNNLYELAALSGTEFLFGIWTCTHSTSPRSEMSRENWGCCALGVAFGLQEACQQGVLTLFAVYILLHIFVCWRVPRMVVRRLDGS